MKKRALVAPLDWGLGHATRCIPVIRQLVANQFEVIIAGSGQSLELLKLEFPGLVALQLPPYKPYYSTTFSMVIAMALQLPKFLSVVWREHRAVEKLVHQNAIDLIISDNRYGCWSSTAYSIFITHQSNIMMPKRFGWMAPMIRRLVEKQMRRFDRCWIPDYADGRLSGSLSLTSDTLRAKISFIGAISRLRKVDMPRVFDVVAIFSGPEPQRTRLEEIVVPQLRSSSLRYFFVRGLPSGTERTTESADFMVADEMEKLMAESAVVICRSGYSTVLDLSRMGKRAIFIPTPGQTEQVYLAEELKRKKIAFSMEQDRFDLTMAISESEGYSGFDGVPEENDLLRQEVSKLHHEIKSVL
jgi:UDP:flavonoid glycosyltransferase YjiC (YdhE family)